ELSNSFDNPFTETTIILDLINEFADFNDRNKITANIIASVKNPLNNISVSLGDINLPDTIIIPTGFSLQVAAKEIINRQNQLNIKIEISLGNEFENKSLFMKTIIYTGFKSEIQYNQDLITEFKNEISKNEDLVTINTKMPITINNTNAVKDLISKGNGDFYFYQDIFVGFDWLMEGFKWSNKPTFKIDFSKTSVEDDNIIFNIRINAGIESQSINIIRPISSFYV
ncbi:MAG: hypothetical protein ACRC63_01175, partial [Metamycoplasmataceae bacterium]